MDQETGEYYYYVVLLIKDSPVRFTFTSRGGEGAKADVKPIVEEINQYIAKPEIARLNIEQPEWIIILVGSIPFFAFNILFIALDIYEGGSNCILDRDRNSFTLTRKKLWRCIDIVEYPLSQIAAVEVDTSDNDGMGGTSYRVSFQLKSGEIIPLTQGYYSYDVIPIVSVIRQFLNLS
ncbi:hypothetical protein H6G41_00010 [Tolypothrix sp. FACHB-123]|uniref:hypothetical protein n=1 Tax=Tolypothrix sp. FACHB-123 TaxID=2692868 RepID=UPI0016861B44|nr:hypothetical protein [Tolypothrix sp. FACHB-123]MBD2353017.1 hypothetical protein [Tolypothrix sp. FACHB-123]